MGAGAWAAAGPGERAMVGGFWGVGAQADSTNRSAVARPLRARWLQAQRAAVGAAVHGARRAAGAAGHTEVCRLVCCRRHRFDGLWCVRHVANKRKACAVCWPKRVLALRCVALRWMRCVALQFVAVCCSLLPPVAPPPPIAKPRFEPMMRVSPPSLMTTMLQVHIENKEGVLRIYTCTFVLREGRALRAHA